MARKKIREYDAKRIFRTQFSKLCSVDIPILVAQATEATSKDLLAQQHPWLLDRKLVVKPDMLFGQRGKHNLVGANLSYEEAWSFIQRHMNRSVTVKGCTGLLSTFVVEPFVPHLTADEFYLCVQTTRLGWDVSFSPRGGMDVEENWEHVRLVSLTGALEDLDVRAELAPLFVALPDTLAQKLSAFAQGCVKVFDETDMTLLEINPFTLDPADALPFPLDMRVELDDTASYRSSDKWEGLEFPLPFGRPLTTEERQIALLDAASTASLKFSLLNPDGRVWLLVAGGGASVIYADTVSDLGMSQELGNYGEYSGAPKEEETRLYAREVLACLVASSRSGKNPGSRVLIVGGGIANMTDVGATFGGIIAALREFAGELRAADVRVFVRRGGPNYEVGLEKMRRMGDELGLPVKVYGPESSMTGICKEAVEIVRSRSVPCAKA